MPIFDQETAELLALWIEGEDKPIRGERSLTLIANIAGAIAIACLIAIICILAFQYFTNQNIRA